jgi:hypothetical protein
MSVYRVEVLQQPSVLRWFQHDDATFAQQHLIAERALAVGELDQLAADVDNQYLVGSPDLFLLGRRLFDFLDGPERWLARIYLSSFFVATLA